MATPTSQIYDSGADARRGEALVKAMLSVSTLRPDARAGLQRTREVSAYLGGDFGGDSLRSAQTHAICRWNARNELGPSMRELRAVQAGHHNRCASDYPISRAPTRGLCAIRQVPANHLIRSRYVTLSSGSFS